MILNSFCDWARAQLINPVLGIWGFWHAAKATSSHTSLSSLWSPRDSSDLYPSPPPTALILAWWWGPGKAGPKFCPLYFAWHTFVRSTNMYLVPSLCKEVLALQLDHRGCMPCCTFPFYCLLWASQGLGMERVLQNLLEHWINICSAAGLQREFQSYIGSFLSEVWLSTLLPVPLHNFTFMNSCDPPSILAREAEPSLCRERQCAQQSADLSPLHIPVSLRIDMAVHTHWDLAFGSSYCMALPLNKGLMRPKL